MLPPAVPCSVSRLVIDNNIKMHHPIRSPSTSGTCELPVENDADVSAVLACGCICGASSLFLEYNPRTPSGPRMNSSNSYLRLYWRSHSGRESVAFLGSIDAPHRVQNFPHVGGSMWEVRLILWEVRSILCEVRFNLYGGLTWRRHIHVASCPYHLSHSMFFYSNLNLLISMIMPACATSVSVTPGDGLDRIGICCASRCTFDVHRVLI